MRKRESRSRRRRGRTISSYMLNVQRSWSLSRAAGENIGDIGNIKNSNKTSVALLNH